MDGFLSRDGFVRRTVFATLAAGVAFCALPVSAAKPGAQAAMVPDATFVMLLNVEAMRNAPIGKELEKLSEKNEAVQEKAPKEFYERLKKETGLTEEDIAGVLFSANLSGIDFDSPKPPDPSTLDLVAAIRLLKPVSLDALQALVEKQIAEQGGEVEFRRERHEGVDVLVGKKAPQAGGEAAPDSEMSTALHEDGKLLFLGSKRGVSGALDRYKSGKTVPPSETMKRARKSIAKGSQMFVIFLPPESLQEKMKTQAKQQQEHMQNGQGGNPMMATSMQSLSTMKATTFSMALDEDMALALQFVLGSAEAAQQLKMVVENMLFGMIRMGLMQVAGGQPMPMMESMKAIQEGSDLTVKLAFTMKDAEMIAAFLEQQAAAGAPVPPAPTGE